MYPSVPNASSSSSLELSPANELTFVLAHASSSSSSAASASTPPVTLTLTHNGATTQQAIAFKVKTTQPRRYLVRPNQGLIYPGHAEVVQILLVDKDKHALLQTYHNNHNNNNNNPSHYNQEGTGDMSSDPTTVTVTPPLPSMQQYFATKDKFLVQSVAVDNDFAAEYSHHHSNNNNNNQQQQQQSSNHHHPPNDSAAAYDQLSAFWSSVSSGSVMPIANMKLHVRHHVLFLDTGAPGGGAAGTTRGGFVAQSPPPASVTMATTAPALLENAAANHHHPTTMSPDQLLAEVNQLRRKYNELVEFSVNVTAERDILNNTLEQTKRDWQREKMQLTQQQKKNQNNRNTTQPYYPTYSSSSSSSSSRSSRGRVWFKWVLMLLGAGVWFLLGARLEASGSNITKWLKDVPMMIGKFMTRRSPPPLQPEPVVRVQDGSSEKEADVSKKSKEEL